MKEWEGKIITASAGTGKTRKIVDEYISILNGFIENGTGHDVNNILAITFTNKAANEMKERIREEIERKIRQDSKNKKVWQEIRSKMNYAWISTIHSFCERILKENFVYLNMDPAFQVLTGASESALMDKIVVSYVMEKLKDLKPLMESFGLKETIELFKTALRRKRYEVLKFEPMELDDERYGKIKRLTSSFLEHFRLLHDRYEEAMIERSKLDFDSLLWRAYKLLKDNDKVREKYKRKFKFIFVDEFQDTNELQKEIIGLIHDPNLNRVFFVGDPKQSIYRFRGADVSVFNRLMDEFGEDKIDYLDKTYRSNPSLVKFFNLFFTQVFKRSNREYAVEYKPVRFDEDRFDPNAPLEKKVKIIVPSGEEGNTEQRAIAKYILHEVEVKRTKRFRDIVILLRGMKGVLDSYTRTFDEFGIPYYVVGGRGFYEKPEIRGLISFMEAINNPKSDSAFVSFLISPMFNLSLDELVKLKEIDNRLYHALEKSDDPYIRNIYEMYSKFRRMKDIARISEVLERIIVETDYLPKLAVFKGSEKMIMNVRKLVEITRDLEREGLSFREFVRFMMSYSPDEESEASVESEEDDVVRIMTIHKSKGLEFNTVIVGSVLRGTQRSSERILCDGENNLMILPHDWDEDDLFLRNMDNLEKDREMEEERRILYVAMTRAKDELVLCGVSKGSTNSVWKAIFSDIGFYDGDWKIPDEFSEVVDIIREDDLMIPQDREMKSLRKLKPLKFIPKETKELKDMAMKTYISPTVIYGEDEMGEGAFGIGDVLGETREMDLGTLAHQILKEVGNKRGGSSTRLKSLRGAKPVVVDGILYTEDDYNEVWNVLNRWIDSEIIWELENANRVYSEMAVSKRFGDRILYGVVDKLYFKDGEWVILDFKFARKNEKNLEKYRFQLIFYAYALREILNPKPRIAKILYLKEKPEDGVVEFTFSDEDFERFEEDLRMRIRRYDEMVKGLERGDVVRIR